MSMNEKNRISDAEWTIMQVLWQKQASSSQEVIDILQSSVAWAPTTIRTLLKRLTSKGFVRIQGDGKRYLYEPVLSESDSMIGAVENLLAHICSKKMGKTIAQLIENTVLTHDDVTLLAEIIEQKRNTAVDQVKCNCLPGLCECKKH